MGTIPGTLIPFKVRQFLLPSTSEKAAAIGQKMYAQFQMAVDPKIYVEELLRVFKGNDPVGPRSFMKELGNNLRDVILARYDSTRSPRHTKRTDKFRSYLNVVRGPFMDNQGVIQVYVGADQIPSFWPILEFGAAPSRRTQTFQVVGRIPQAKKKALAPFLSGAILPSRALRKAQARRMQLLKTRNKAFGTKAQVSIPSYQGFGQGYVDITRGIKLIPRTKEDLKRIKRKIAIEFMHPGIKAGEFFREGIKYILTEGDDFVSNKMDKTLSLASARVNMRVAHPGAFKRLFGGGKVK